MANPSATKIEQDEITVIYANYDYWTGRAVRILMNEISPNLLLVISCLNCAIKLRTTMSTRKAKQMAQETYATLEAARMTINITDLQLKVVELLASARPDRVSKALKELLELELLKTNQKDMF